MKKLHIGCIVICIKCDQIPELIGHVGEITGRNGTFEWGEYSIPPWICKFPGLPELRCPDCHKFHKVKCWHMDSDEIKPIEDPDSELTFIDEEELIHNV